MSTYSDSSDIFEDTIDFSTEEDDEMVEENVYYFPSNRMYLQPIYEGVTTIIFPTQNESYTFKDVMRCPVSTNILYLSDVRGTKKDLVTFLNKLVNVHIIYYSLDSNIMEYETYINPSIKLVCY